MCPSTTIADCTEEQSSVVSGDDCNIVEDSGSPLDWTVTPDTFQSKEGNAYCEVTVAIPRRPELPRCTTGPTHRVHLRRMVAIKPQAAQGARASEQDGSVSSITVSANDFSRYRGNVQELLRHQVVVAPVMPPPVPEPEKPQELEMSFRSKYRLRCEAPEQPRDPWQGMAPADEYFEPAEGNLTINQVWVRPDHLKPCRESSSSSGKRVSLVGLNSTQSPTPRSTGTHGRMVSPRPTRASPVRSSAQSPVPVERQRPSSQGHGLRGQGIVSRPGSRCTVSPRPASRGASRCGSSRRVSSCGPVAQPLPPTPQTTTTTSSLLPPLPVSIGDSPPQSGAGSRGRSHSRQ